MAKLINSDIFNGKVFNVPEIEGIFDGSETVTLKYIPEGLFEKAQKAWIIRKGKGVERDAEKMVTGMKTLVSDSIVSWSGFYDTDGTELACTPENKIKVLDQFGDISVEDGTFIVWLFYLARKKENWVAQEKN